MMVGDQGHPFPLSHLPQWPVPVADMHLVICRTFLLSSQSIAVKRMILILFPRQKAQPRQTNMIWQRVLHLGMSVQC